MLVSNDLVAVAVYGSLYIKLVGLRPLLFITAGGAKCEQQGHVSLNINTRPLFTDQSA